MVRLASIACAFTSCTWLGVTTLAAPMAQPDSQPKPPSQPVSSPASTESDAQDRGWPRQFESDGNRITVYAPQVDEWPNFDRITFRSAISVASKGSEDRVFGIIRVSAATKISVEERLVILTDRQVQEVSFPGVEPDESARLRAIVDAAMPPSKPQSVSLDRLIAAVDPSQVPVRKVELNIEPPTIITSQSPAIMVIFMGKPRFKPVPQSDLLFAINTNWDIFQDPAAKKFYMRNGESWLVTADLDKGPWTAASTLPESLSKLPPDENWSDVLAAIPGTPLTQVPAVHVVYQPAELVVTQGEPEFEPISGTSIMMVANTEDDLFYEPVQKQFYLLAAGRWFKASDFGGPWSAASNSLPEDFKKIPEDSAAADVLVAVPGTAAAKEAVVMASIPEKATINRSEATLNVTYDGTPAFRPIESTTVQYAYNTPFSVFLVDGKYYACNNAVWFEAPTPTGAWTVTSEVPKAIYTIPPTSPKYNVTYVTVYESTPTTVTTGYTSGYSGASVAATGVVMFGLGLVVAEALDDDDHYWVYRYPPSYGSGAVWHSSSGGYVAASRHYGPYGGAGRAAAYNPSTGVYSRAGYAYGPTGATGYRTAYNPSTGVAGARAGGTSPYGSWGRAAVTNGDEWVRAGQSTTSRGTVGAIQTSQGGAMVTSQRAYGNGTTVAKDSEGDYYAAKNGNVYKKGDDGWEQTRNNPTGTSPATKAANTTATKPTSRPTSTSSASSSAELQQQAAARERGTRNSAAAQQTRRSGVQRSRPSGGRSGGRR